jgi:hypothetical protein
MPYLPKIPIGKLSFTASWFAKVRDRIEENCIYSGKYVKIIKGNEGSVVDFDDKVSLREITVCEDGKIKKLRFFVYDDEARARFLNGKS